MRTCIYATNTKIQMVQEDMEGLAKQKEELRGQSAKLETENHRLLRDQEAVLRTAADVAEQMKQLRGHADANKQLYEESLAEEKAKVKGFEKEVAGVKAEFAAMQARLGVKKEPSGRKGK